MRARRSFLVSLVVACGSVEAAAQCLETKSGFGVQGASNRVLELEAIDDGSGERLYAGGWFDVIGDARAFGVARYDGASWQPLPGSSTASPAPPSTTLPDVTALIGFDDGSGWALWAGGKYSRLAGYSLADVARWRPTTGWEQTGSLRGIFDFEVFDAGSGPALYACGEFRDWGGITYDGLARWNGNAWVPIGGGVAGLSRIVHSMTVFDDGSGPALYFAGSFSSAGGVPANAIGRWDGTSFSSLGSGILGTVLDLCVYDDGSGPALHAGGTFFTAGGTAAANVAKWNGSAWSQPGAGVPFVVNSLSPVSDSTTGGTRLVAGGSTGFAGGLAAFQAGSWTTFGGSLDSAVDALAAFDGGPGERLYVGGWFKYPGAQPIERIARWEASGWQALAPDELHGVELQSAVAFDDGSGAAIYADLAPEGQGVMRWNGSTWSQAGGSTVGGSLFGVRHLAVFDAGTGPSLYAVGGFTSFGATPCDGFARWDGSTWLAAPAPGLGLHAVYDSVVFDDGGGPSLYVAGNFGNGERVRRFDGLAWHDVGQTLVGTVRALELYDDGTGLALYAGGFFAIGAGPDCHLARWNGTTWAPVGTAPNGGVNALAVHGQVLCAGGDFTSIGGIAAGHAAKYDGSWSPLCSGSGFSGPVLSLAAVRDDGRGSALYAGGAFADVDGVSSPNLARFDGTAWSAPAHAPDADVRALVAIDAGPDGMPSLWLGGTFTGIGATTSFLAGALQPACPCPPTSYCTAKVNSLGCTPFVHATGVSSISANTFRVRAANVLNNKSGLLFWGRSPRAAPFQGGVLCVDSPKFRTPVQTSGGNPPPDDCSGEYAFHFSGNFMTSQGIAPGERIHCQYWSRDPASPSATGLTDALSFLVCP